MLSDKQLDEINEAINNGESDEYRGNELAHRWGRIAKIGEEYGEVINALIGATGQNFRKGYYSSWPEVYKELGDVVFTAIEAMIDLSGSAEETLQYLEQHLDVLHARMSNVEREK